MPDDSRTKIKVIAKAIAVLRAISLGSSRLNTIARDVDLTRNQVFRILHSLMDEGIVTQDPVSREYFMGPRLFEITANPLRTHENLINAAYLEMNNLMKATGETVRLDIKFGMEKIILRQVIGTHQLTYIGETNPVAHLWKGSVGKALLSQIDDSEMDYIFEKDTFALKQLPTAADKTAFKKEIEKVKRLGFAASFSEIEEGVASLAAPIKGYIVPAALTVIGPDHRLKSQQTEYLEKLKSAAAAITHNLTATN